MYKFSKHEFRLLNSWGFGFFLVGCHFPFAGICIHFQSETVVLAHVRHAQLDIAVFEVIEAHFSWLVAGAHNLNGRRVMNHWEHAYSMYSTAHVFMY